MLKNGPGPGGDGSSASASSTVAGPATARTDAREFQLMPGNLESAYRAGHLLQVAERIGRYVDYRTAPHAAHVVVPMKPAVIPPLPATQAECPDKPCLRKEFQIAVDGAQTDVRHPSADTRIDGIGRGMVVGRLQLIQYDSALTGHAEARWRMVSNELLHNDNCSYSWLCHAIHRSSGSQGLCGKNVKDIRHIIFQRDRNCL